MPSNLRLYQQSLWRQVNWLCQVVTFSLDEWSARHLQKYLTEYRIDSCDDCAVAARQYRLVAPDSPKLYLPRLTAEQLIWYLTNAETGLDGVTLSSSSPRFLGPGDISVDDACRLGRFLRHELEAFDQRYQPDVPEEDKCLLQRMLSPDPDICAAALEGQRLLLEAQEVTRDLAYTQAAKEIASMFLAHPNT